MQEIFVCPSILSANLNCLSNEVQLLKQAGAYGLHVDVMDGHFVDNISFGVPIVESLRGCGLVLDVHLMITNPFNFLENFVNAGANFITFHVECFDNLKDCALKLKNLGCKVGLALKPFTNIHAVEHFLVDPKLVNLVDLIVVMTVEPGFAGQAFMKDMIFKVEQLRKLNSTVHIAVDGGVNFETAKMAVDAGADWLIAGSSIFKCNNYEKAVHQLKFCNSLID